MRRTLTQLAAQTMLLDASKQETFIVNFATSVAQLRMTNIVPGQLYCFVMKQDDKGSHTLNWGSEIRNPIMFNPQPNAITVQCFIGLPNGIMQAVPPGTWNEEMTP